MPERLDIRRGDTLPQLRFTVRAKPGQMLPSVTGAVAYLYARAVGSSAAAEVLPGSVTLSLANNVITGIYSPTGEETAEVGEFDAECEITFASGGIMTVPPPRNGVSRFFRISVTADLGDAGVVIPEEEVDLGSASFGDLFGEWVS
jgi:hypothetical protein